MTEAPQFEEDLLKERSENEKLNLYLGSFDGPIDMLLSLARDQKVDLAKISILSLATQYLEFVERAQKVRLELAADYLVMAAWLAFLKSRLLIPQDEKKEAEPSAQEIADALQFQLRRLEATRKVAEQLFHLPRLGYNVFARGEPDGLPTAYISKYEMTYYDLLKAYGDIKQRQKNSIYKLTPVKLFSLEEAIERMEHMMGKIPQEWVSLFMFLPAGLKDKIVKRSAIASTFGGALELVKRGKLQLQQEKNYAPIYIRRPSDKTAVNENAPAAEMPVVETREEAVAEIAIEAETFAETGADAEIETAHEEAFDDVVGDETQTVTDEDISEASDSETGAEAPAEEIQAETETDAPATAEQGDETVTGEEGI